MVKKDVFGTYCHFLSILEKIYFSKEKIIIFGSEKYSEKHNYFMRILRQTWYNLLTETFQALKRVILSNLAIGKNKKKTHAEIRWASFQLE